MSVVHMFDRNPEFLSLEEYRVRIIQEVDGVALRVGRWLREARESNPELFGRWVERDLPFGMETARRLMAISAAYEKLPPDLLRELPRPWQAMYALKELPKFALEEGIAAGSIHSGMTVEQAKAYGREIRGTEHHLYRKMDKVAGRLLRGNPGDLSTVVRIALLDWLTSSKRSKATVDVP